MSTLGTNPNPVTAFPLSLSLSVFHLPMALVIVLCPASIKVKRNFKVILS